MEGEHQQWTARHLAAVEAAQSQQLLKTESERAEFEQASAVLCIEHDFLLSLELVIFNLSYTPQLNFHFADR